MPILRSLQEGIRDHRYDVREACAEALCTAILDKHAQAVPAGVLVEILGDIMPSAILTLGDNLIDDIRKLDQNPQAAEPHNRIPFNKENLTTHLSSATASLQKNWVNIKVKEELQIDMVSKSSEGSILHHDLNSSANSLAPNVRSEEVSTVENCISSLAHAFLLYLRKLATYPTFDKLWLRILSIFSYFLGDHTNDESGIHYIAAQMDKHKDHHKVKELQSIFSVCHDKLHHLLMIMITDGVFDKRHGLWIITKETVTKYRECQNLIDEIATSLKE